MLGSDWFRFLRFSHGYLDYEWVSDPSNLTQGSQASSLLCKKSLEDLKAHATPQLTNRLSTHLPPTSYDAPFHLAEECSNANIASPRAIVMTAQLGFYMGWAIILVIAYTVTDITAVVSGGQPFGVLCEQVLGRRAGLALFGLNIVAQFFVGEGCTITATRVVFAFARDGALPGSRIWSQVDKRTRTPVYATWGVLVVAALLGLLSFAGPVAIGAVFSIGMLSLLIYLLYLHLRYAGGVGPDIYHLLIDLLFLE